MLLRSSPPPPCVPQFPRRTRPLLSPRRCPFKARLLPRKGRGLSRTRRTAPPPGRRLGASFRRWAGSGEGGGRARAAAWGWAGGVAGTGGPWRSAAWGEGRAGPGLDSTPVMAAVFPAASRGEGRLTSGVSPLSRSRSLVPPQGRRCPSGPALAWREGNGAFPALGGLPGCWERARAAGKAAFRAAAPGVARGSGGEGAGKCPGVSGAGSWGRSATEKETRPSPSLGFGVSVSRCRYSSVGSRWSLSIAERCR